jgi:hypothetical protein
LWLGLIAVGVTWVVGLYLRDSRDLHPFWKVWLLVLRLGLWAGVLAIAVNPQERTQTTSFRPSRVAVVIDTSLSMQLPEKSPDEVVAQHHGQTGLTILRSRADAARQRKVSADRRLRRHHDGVHLWLDVGRSALAVPQTTMAASSREADAAEVSGDLKTLPAANW